MRNMVHCPVCKSLYSDEHKHCPFCGARKPAVTFKYILSGVLIIALFALLIYLILSYQT